ncbi:MAG TPA: DUF4920 domain-containing protein, partial [Mucilaginibacter sp.]|nr:DUF4920 domain-containing protein [Mucilaginibacter sp.]
TSGAMDITKLEEFMGAKARVSVAIKGKILKVTKEKGGWFTMDEGKGQTIAAHFKNYNVTIPSSLAGRTVIVDGVASKQFVADDQQHLAGNAGSGKASSKRKAIAFAVNGMFVDK